MRKIANVTPEQILNAVQDDEGVGFCTSCGNEQMGVEPDAEKYKCENCGKHRVYGAEQLLLMGYAGGY